MRRIKKLNRSGVRRNILKILKEALDPSTMTLQQIIDSGLIEDMDDAIELLRNAKRSARGQAKAERASTEAEKTAKAKQIIAYYLVNYIAPANLAAAGDNPEARSAMFQHAVPKSLKSFDPQAMKVVEKPHKFTKKQCEILVFWTFDALGIELTGGTALKPDGVNPVNHTNDSARRYAELALDELEAEGLIVTNKGVPGVRPTGLRMGVPSDAEGLGDIVGDDFDSDNFRLKGPDPMNEIRKMIIKEFVDMSGDLGIDLDIDVEYSFGDEDVEGLGRIADMLSPSEASAVETVVGEYQIGMNMDEGYDQLDTYADSLNQEYLDEEIELGSDILDDDFDYEG